MGNGQFQSKIWFLAIQAHTCAKYAIHTAASISHQKLKLPVSLTKYFEHFFNLTIIAAAHGKHHQIVSHQHQSLLKTTQRTLQRWKMGQQLLNVRFFLISVRTSNGSSTSACSIKRRQSHMMLRNSRYRWRNISFRWWRWKFSDFVISRLLVFTFVFLSLFLWCWVSPTINSLPCWFTFDFVDFHFNSFGVGFLFVL